MTNETIKFLYDKPEYTSQVVEKLGAFFDKHLK